MVCGHAYVTDQVLSVLKLQLKAYVGSAGVDTSCKTAFIMRLLPELVTKGHRTLIFSQSRVMLDILQAAISQKGYTFCRIDGSVASAADRQVTLSQPHITSKHLSKSACFAPQPQLATARCSGAIGEARVYIAAVNECFGTLFMCLLQWCAPSKPIDMHCLS